MPSNLKRFIRKMPFVNEGILWHNAIRAKPSLLKRARLMRAFNADLKSYARQKPNPAALIAVGCIKPSIYDRTDTTPVDPVYFYQDAWCVKKVVAAKPLHHCDIGSKAEMLGILAQIVPVTMIDIRPIGLSLPGLIFVKGSILDLPFKDSSISSLSSICVMEHIGLGRYGDPIDSFGTEKAARELIRVLAKDGNLYISVSVDSDNRVYFNSHRAFTRSYVLDMFKGLKLVEEKYIYRRDMQDSYDPSIGFGTGMFHFRK